MPTTNRRKFLTAAAGGALAVPFSHLFHQQVAHGRFPLSLSNSPYGPLAPVADGTTGLPLLQLPQGFSYYSNGWTGDLMSDGTLTPDRHDGMAVVVQSGQRVTLIRNHERGPSDLSNPLPTIGDASTPTYDAFAIPGVIGGLGGGTTALTLDGGQLVSDQATLAGTLTNCAGGLTPWGAWLTCEETIVRSSPFLPGLKDHGFVYEVPAPQLGAATAQPIKDMGRMDHEAICVDPRTSQCYLTEDNGPNSGFYRYTPDDLSGTMGSLEKGGQLEMLKVIDQDNADLRNPEQGQSFDVEWVPIEQPDSDAETYVPPDDGFPPVSGAGRSGPYLQGEGLGAARFQRGEGCWYHRGVIYWVDTSGGPAGKGVLWAYVPERPLSGRAQSSRWRQRLRQRIARRRGGSFGRPAKLIAVFVSPGDQTADNPDNVTLSPRGGILMCEDGGGIQDAQGNTVTGTRLIGLNRVGTAFPFAENNMVLSSPIAGKPFILPGDYRGREFAGATFDRRGRWLYVNIQTPGVTFAITGPFWRGCF